jgi:hypothetical protein
MHTKLLWGKPQGRRALGIHMRRWEDNIKTNIREVKWVLGLD